MKSRTSASKHYRQKIRMTEMSDKEKLQCFSKLKNGTKLGKILCAITVASLLIIVAMAITSAYFGYRYNTILGSGNLSNVCLTAECVKIASKILSSIDETIDPCDDFYRFACGQWLKTHAIPEEDSSLTIVGIESDNLNLRVKALMEAQLDGSEPSFITMLKDYYDTCMDMESIEKVGADPLKRILKSLGGWPVIEGNKWDERKFDWIETMISLRKMGFDSLLKCYVAADFKNNSRHTLYVDETSLRMPDRTYLINGLNDAATAAYFKKMVKAATLLGADERIAERELLEALQFEMNIANCTAPEEEKRNFSEQYNKYSIKELQEMFPQVPWLKYFNGFLKNEIYENETLIIRFPEFMKKLLDLVANTDKRAIANYMHWTIVDTSATFLSKKWRNIKLEYDTALYGVNREKPRWKKCLPKDLYIALSSLYVHHHFNSETKNKASELVEYVYKQFLSNLDDIDWMDEKTKAHARAKADNMLFYIAYPDELLNNTAVMEHYQNLSISKDSYFENFNRIRKWLTDNHFSRLRKPNIRKDWKKYAEVVIVNAFYNPEGNSIILPGGYLHSPFFDKDQPNYMNFGMVGSMAGHEITHGFDDQGRQFDKNGNNINWWESSTDESFKRKAECVINLYSNYTAENGMKVNGLNTLGENIADIAGVKTSYLAYQSWVKDNGPEQLLPGLNYNQNQLFWITSAYEYCSLLRPERLKGTILADPHSPSEFRIIGRNSNLHEFAKDFNCPLGSRMNRKQKCQVW